MLSGGAALWFAWDVDWGPLASTLAAVKPGWIALAAGIVVFEFVLRALRWTVLLRPLGSPRARPHDLFVAQIVGAAANTLFPLRAGELARPVVAARRTGHPLSTVLATAVMERVYDLFGLVCVLVLMSVSFATRSLETTAGAAEQTLIHNLQLYGGLFGLFALGCMAIFFTLATRKQAARATFGRILRLGPPPARRLFMGLFDGFVAGLGNARDLRGLVQAGLLSVWMWVDGAIAIWCLFQAFGMALPFGAACFTAVAIALTVALPQAPGFLGVFHVAMEKTMVLWGQPESMAEGFAIVFWAVSFLPITLLGLGALWREGLELDALRDLRLLGQPGDESAPDEGRPAACPPEGEPAG